MTNATSSAVRSSLTVRPPSSRRMTCAAEAVCRRVNPNADSANSVAVCTRASIVEINQPVSTADDAACQRAFMAAATHDLRTPLSSLTMWIDTLQLLRPRLESGRDTQALVLLDQALEQIQTLLQRSVHLVDDVLDVTRVEAGGALPFAPGDVDMVALAREVLERHPHTEENQLRLELAHTELRGWWDADRLMRVVENLVANAIKYSPRGHPVTVRVMPEQIEDESWVVLQVADDGIGIPADELPKIFEPFHRAPNVTSDVSGYGLGLWGSKAIVEQHGGILTVVSREGEGTTVTVLLPARASTPAKPSC